ncbi:MFS transporter [Erysipelothrix rhusiopathiae]|uniref:MFS transporter n=1 Tax=Erysipelothrix rhusiopathiae TaxID=1648 RepID=UPI000F4330C8|nr:MFS transporter [Erysipelothrix rhusiopathiae]AYV35181.1 MFS transporter [Erysipelothrix rhusiopathiae]MDE8082662.1 MFS transporter [Erysipelothrix rhusiopathiae]MDE8314807.1 MFS transporter [Erysipelothrix rhusiopathiae]MDE8329722.1 MFS transporter [Erysipelothrix rhusiopathiae]MDE8333541.1 MFS transporter [Erysipelothrix rhusiopathiae]
MSTFFKLNWLVFVVTIAILFAGYYAEKKKHIISHQFGIEMKSFYGLIALLGIIIAIINYVAIVIFGSWQTMIFATLITVALGSVLFYFLKHRNKK